MEITWISHACFKIKTNSGRVIYLDPYQISDGEDKADIIVASHGHFDHIDDKAIKKVWKEDSVLIGPASLGRKLKKHNGKGLNIGESIEIGDIKVELVPGYTLNKSTHPKSNEWAGIIIHAEGKKIYHAGDSDRIPEMKDLADKNITVAILPCGGTYTMDMNVATDCAIDIKPEIAIPMHNWEKNLTEFKDLLAKKDPNIKVEILENKTLTL